MKVQNLLLVFSFVVSVVSAAIVGVDYGQEFTKAVLVAPGVPFEVLLTTDSKRKDISGLGLKKLPNGDLERVYGSHALSHCIKSPSTCLVHLKQLFGKSIGDSEVVDYVSMHTGVTLAPTKGQRNTIAFDMSKLGTFPVEEAFAMSLEDIKARAQDHLKSVLSTKYSVNDIVITVPPFFNQAQRRAIIDGAEIAGFNVIGLVDDGTAVAVNYVSSRQYDDQKQFHIVYDMGAGSTKATLFSVANNKTSGGLIVEIEGIGYDDKLSGDLLTKSVLDILTEKFLDQYKKVKSKEFVNNAKSMTKLWQAAEKAKMILSANNEASVSVESLYKDFDFRAVISRDEFQEYNSNLMPRVTKPILDIIKSPLSSDLSIKLADINSVILTGGSTRVPFIQKHLTTLVGDEKIAKNVNADEAAALGVTLRGVLISNMFKAKDISVVERSISDYEAVIDSKTFPVFPKGSEIGESVVLELEGVEGEDFTVDLYENGHLFQSHVFTDVAKSTATLNESDSVKYFGTFTLSNSRLFTLDKLQVKGETKKGVLEKLFGGSDEAEEQEQAPIVDGEEDSGNSTGPVTSDEKPPRVRTITLTGKSHYPKQHPMSTYTKQNSITKLKEFSLKDSARKRRDTIRNTLESALYDLRSYLEDVSSDELSSGLIKEANELVTNYLEWLDYESDDASASVMKEKLEDIQVIKLKIIAYTEFLNKPLDDGEFGNLHKLALKSMHEIQDIMLSMAEDASSLKQNFTAIGLDWESENKKIKVSNLPPLDDKDVQQVFMSLNNDLEDLIEKNLIKTEDTTGEGVEKYDKDELFAIHQAVNEKILKLDEFKKLLEKAHTQRTSALKKVYRKNFMKKLKEAQLAAAAEKEAEKEEEEAQAEEQNKQQEETESSQEQQVEEEEQEVATDEATKHDEL